MVRYIVVLYNVSWIIQLHGSQVHENGCVAVALCTSMMWHHIFYSFIHSPSISEPRTGLSQFLSPKALGMAFVLHCKIVRRVFLITLSWHNSLDLTCKVHFTFFLQEVWRDSCENDETRLISNRIIKLANWMYSADITLISFSLVTFINWRYKTQTGSKNMSAL